MGFPALTLFCNDHTEGVDDDDEVLDAVNASVDLKWRTYEELEHGTLILRLRIERITPLKTERPDR